MYIPELSIVFISLAGFTSTFSNSEFILGIAFGVDGCIASVKELVCLFFAVTELVVLDCPFEIVRIGDVLAVLKNVDEPNGVVCSFNVDKTDGCLFIVDRSLDVAVAVELDMTFASEFSVAVGDSVLS